MQHNSQSYCSFAVDCMFCRTLPHPSWLLSMMHHGDLGSVKEAMILPWLALVGSKWWMWDWRTLRRCELHRENVVHAPPVWNIVGSKHGYFGSNCKADRKHHKYKATPCCARLSGAQGFTQVYGVDYFGDILPVATKLNIVSNLSLQLLCDRIGHRLLWLHMGAYLMVS